MMNIKMLKANLIRSGLAASALLFASGAALAQSAVTLTASSQSAAMPDGNSVPMWGYTCGAVTGTGVSCTALNGSAQTGSWQPPLIRVPAGSPLTITLFNQLPAKVPTSLVVVGQLGGGLGANPKRMASPTHGPQGTTWPGTLGGTGPNDPTFTPPAQVDRVRSFGVEVLSGGSSDALVWNNLRPGTYLIESGTEPSIQGPMGLYAVLVVTDPAVTPTAYGATFDQDVPLLFSEIDPAQNAEVAQVVLNAAFSETAVWDGQVGKCGDVGVSAAAHSCYPPAVNYSPRYYLINGVSFDAGNTTASAMAVPATATQGRVLLRFVNAGLRMHVPSVVGAPLTLRAEDGNKLPGLARVQNEVFLAPGKTFDVTIQPAADTTTPGQYKPATYPVFDRALGLSTNNQLDGGMQAYLQVAGGATSGAGSVAQLNPATAVTDSYSVVGNSIAISDPAKGVMANDSGIYGVAISGTPAGMSVSLNPNGTFTVSGFTTDADFNYCGNGAVSGAACAVVHLSACTATTCVGSKPVAKAVQFTSNVATRYISSTPGVLGDNVKNPSGFALAAALVGTPAGITMNADGSFTAAGPGTDCPTLIPAAPTGASCVQFQYEAKTSTGLTSDPALATVVFLPASNLAVNVKDAKNGVGITDFRWIIEEDQTVKVDPKCQVNVNPRPLDSFNRPCPALPVMSQGYNFHTAHMPVVAAGCVGTISCELGQTLGGAPAVCDVGDGACRLGDSKAPLDPRAVHLDSNKHYFISILPGDGVNATIGGATGPVTDPTVVGGVRQFDIAMDCGDYAPGNPAWIAGDVGAICGHAMGGAPIAVNQSSVDIKLQRTPLPTAKISVQVYQDDNPLNGENDAGGGVDVLAPNEPGLGGFEVKLFDQAGGLGDATGQITYDMFNMPVSNALAGKKDPVTGNDACPITKRSDGLVGMIPACPTYESDGKTLSPLAGQVVIANLYPGLYEVVASPSADRIARGEEWLQTNTLDGGKPHEAFIKPDEPGYFQEFGPGGYHVSIGFANPKVINNRKAGYCSGRTGDQACTHKLTVHVTNAHMSRTPDQRTYSSESYDHYAFTQCYVSIGPADAEDFAFKKCDLTQVNGKTVATANFDNMPNGVYKISVFDQWNDIMLDGLVGTISVKGDTVETLPVTQWRTNLATRTFIDNGCGPTGTAANAGDGVSQDCEPGLALVNTNIHYRDGSVGFFNNTDLNGYAGFNEVFPFMNWLVVDTSSTRYKVTGVHAVYDAGGPVDGSAAQPGVTNWTPSDLAANVANTQVRVPLPRDLRMPGARYCDNADCSPTDTGASGGQSTGAVFPPQAWGTTMGWQGLLGQNTFIEFGVKPFKASAGTAPAENGGISGMVIYASTRPFDDPALSLQLSWEPGIPRVKVNLYKKEVDASGHEKLTLADTTTTASWDDWSQGFRKGADGTTLLTAGTADKAGKVPNMNCPGQAGDSPFFATLKDSKQWLDADGNTLAYHSQFKCYDGWSQLNQVQPAPYDGLYKFPSVVAIDPANGKSAKSNCLTCVPNPDDGTPMLPAGKYVVEVVMPPGYELVKEEDKNILLGDVYIAPVTQQFGGPGNIFIMPDQAAVNASYNPNNPGSLNLTTNLGATPRHEGDTGSIESFWPCVGAERIVPDLNSLYPGAGQAAPFAGAKRRLCDRKEVTLQNEAAALAKFYIFSSTHIAGHFTGTITNDFAAEFDPFSPQFGEKFGPPNLPVAMRDFTGNEVARVYSDQWGIYNGLYFSSYSVNPPNPTGYVPQMSIACMNDPGPILGPDGTTMITDPAYNPAYSNFCYETPFMPGFTAYMDTPVIPTQSFADGYNLPDTEYPDGTPTIGSVVSDSAKGPWIRWAGSTPARVAFSISGVDPQGTTIDQVTSVTIGATTVTTGPIACVASAGCPSATTTNAIRGRNTWMAQQVAANINAGTSGYTATSTNASATAPYPASVTITAPLGTGADTSAVVVTQVGLTVPATLAMAGGSGTAPSGTLTINCPGGVANDCKKEVQNPNYSGPNATVAPYNQKTITRQYGFGNQCTSPAAGSPTCNTLSSVTIRGVTAPVTGWSTTSITVSVPAGIAPCRVQQRGQTATLCGEMVITAGNGKQSIDAITVTVGGSEPWVVTPNDFATNTGGAVIAPAGKSVKDYTTNLGRMFFSPIQTAIDSANPGDLILVQPGVYRENLIMWKPVRLQGVGANSVTINADAHPAGKMDQWRRQVVCAFGLDLDGRPNLNNVQANFDPTGKYTCPNAMFLKADRIPFEAITGWDASGNGNLAQVLQEPTLMGAYEGAGITVVGRGVRVPRLSTDFWGADPTAAGAFAAGSRYLTAGDCDSTGGTDLNRNYATSNYHCNPSRIDGVSIINSSQGGGGVFVHGWGHNLVIANTRIQGNHGTLAGAINLGNGETPPVFLNDGATCGAGVTTLCPPIPEGTPTGAAIPFGFNTRVHIHNNMLYNNASIGDALFTGTPAGAGGVTVSSGGDNYHIHHNWIAGNLSTGDGGGVQTLGVSFNGRITNNYVLFNQSTNPTLPTNGGGIVIQGANEPRSINGQECGAATDVDCPPGLGDGTGANLIIDGNLILGNSAESGSGGGISLLSINGSEMIAFPLQNSRWYGVTLSNNIIANNVAGWDGGGVSMQDALKVTLANNTIASNDTTASAGALFKTLGAINTGSTPPGCLNFPAQQQNLVCPQDGAPHSPQPAGLVTLAHTPNLIEAIGTLSSVLGVKVLCPAPTGQGFGYTGTLGANGDCMKVSKPRLVNDLFWHNRAFEVNVVDVAGNIVGNGDGTGTPTGTGLLSQQNLIAVMPLLNQSKTGECAVPTTGTVPGTFYYDMGLRTDDVLAGNASFTANKLVSYYSIISGDPQNVVTKNNPVTATGTPFIAEYCNGARVAPEKGDAFKGYNAPPGASETTGLATVFVFNGIRPTATVDEGHNWLNLTYGPLTLNRSAVNTSAADAPELMVASASIGAVGGAYSITGISDAAGAGIVNGLTPATDFFGRPRFAAQTSVGAVEVAVVPPVLTSISPSSGVQGATVPVTLTGSALARTSVINAGADINCAITAATRTSVSANCAIAASAATGARDVTVTTPGGTSNAVTFTVNVAPPNLTLISPTSGIQGRNVTVTLTGTGLSGTSLVTVSGTGVSCTINGTPTATSVSASCAIAATAATGARTVTVTTPVGVSNGLSFTVNLPPPPAPNPALNCPNTCIGGSSTSWGAVSGNVTKTFTLSNSGPGAFKISAISAAKLGGGNGIYTVTGGTCVVGNTVSNGGSCIVIVNFNSQSNFSITLGRLTVTGTASDGSGSYSASRALAGS